MTMILDGSLGLTTPGVVNTAGETIATTLAVTGATNLGALTTTGNTILGDDSTDTLNVGNGGLVKDASGNVGIGTSSPTVKLDVLGDAKFGATVNTGAGVTTGVASIELGSLRTGDGVAHIDFHGISGGDYQSRAIRSGGVNGALLLTNTGTGNFAIRQEGAGSILFDTTNTERMRIDSSGNVGIGTASPASKLAVGGNPPTAGVLAAVSSSGGVSLALSDNANNSLYVKHVASGVATFGTDSGGQIAFATNGFTERMRIDSSGNVHIGKTAGGAATIGNTFGLSSSGLEYNESVSTNAGGTLALWYMNRQTSTGSIIDFRQATTAVGSITVTASATAYNTSSDYRLKENIAPMVGALDTVAQLKPVTYNWKADGSSSQGFIAHELAEVVPDCVSGEKDAVENYIDEEGNEQTRIKPQGIDTSFLVATLTAAIQEQQALITQLQADVAALKALSA